MAALDICEPQMLRAFAKDGWRVEDKPYSIRTSLTRTVFADFSLYRIIDNKIEFIIVVEVKCFSNPTNDLHEFYTAVGQYQLYANALMLEEKDHPLFLAMPNNAYERLVDDPAIQNTLSKIMVKLVLVDLEKEEITQWINLMPL